MRWDLVLGVGADLLFVAGFVAIAWGARGIYEPAGVIVLGATGVLCGVALGRRRGR